MAESIDTAAAPCEQPENAPIDPRLLDPSRCVLIENTGPMRLPGPGREVLYCDAETGEVFGISKSHDEPIPGYED